MRNGLRQGNIIESVVDRVHGPDTEKILSPPASSMSFSSIAPAVPAEWMEEGFVSGLVTVIIPAYNRSNWIGQTLDSLAQQTWRQLEVIVVDDGSTDGTLERLRERAPMGAGRELRLLGQANAGVSAARNTGTRAATGEFIIYLDSDDLLFPNAVARYVEALSKHQAGYCIAPIDSTDEEGRLINDHRRYYPNVRSSDFLFGCFWLVHGACYRREVLRAAEPWNMTLSQGEDHEFYWRIKVTSGAGCYLDVVQGSYRQHSRDQLHHQIDRRDFYKIRLKSLDIFTAWLEQRGRLDRAMRIRLAHQYRSLATRLMVQGEKEYKNYAIRQISRLSPPLWHPLRFYAVLRYLNAPLVYEQLAMFKYGWRRRMCREHQPASASQAKKPSSLLFISPTFPDPEGSGPARRANAVINALAQSLQVTLLVIPTALHAGSKPVGPEYLGGRWASVPFKPGRWQRWRRGIERWAPRLSHWLWRQPSDWHDLTRARRKMALATFDGQHFDIVHAFRLAMAPYALALRPNQSAQTRFQLDLDDIESVTHARMADLMRKNGESRQAEAHARKAGEYARAEREFLPQFDRVFVCSEADRQRLPVKHPDVRVLPNTAPRPAAVEICGSPAGSADGFRLLFLGLLGYYPNKDGLAWFCREIFPRLHASRACILLAGGRAMPRELQQLLDATPGVVSIGEFATASEAFLRGDALVVPLRAGGGTRIKILEAFAHGKPVVSTSLGIEGIEAVAERDFLLAETAAEFIRQISRLMEDPELRERLAGNARRLWAGSYMPERLPELLADTSTRLKAI
jgi:glycosyltransferase involved in cell wall biosynthesis